MHFLVIGDADSLDVPQSGGSMNGFLLAVPLRRFSIIT